MQQLKEFVKKNNIWTARPSGKYGGLLGIDYNAAI